MSRLRSFTLDSQCGRLWLYQPPATGTQTGVWHPAGNEQGPAATTESACAKRRCALHPGGLLPGCQERRSRRDRGGATGTVAASTGVWRQGWKPARAETAPLAPFTTARPARGTPGKAINRRGTERIRGRRRTVTCTVTTEK